MPVAADAEGPGYATHVITQDTPIVNGGFLIPPPGKFSPHNLGRKTSQEYLQGGKELVRVRVRVRTLLVKFWWVTVKLSFTGLSSRIF